MLTARQNGGGKMIHVAIKTCRSGNVNTTSCGSLERRMRRADTKLGAHMSEPDEDHPVPRGCKLRFHDDGVRFVLQHSAHHESAAASRQLCQEPEQTARQVGQ